MREYRRKLRTVPAASDERTPAHLRELVKNNLALNARNCSADVWFLFSDRRIKNTFANAQVIVIKTLASGSRVNAP
jgi:hypothetical protein